MILSGRPPFRGNNNDEIKKAVCDGQWSWKPEYGTVSALALDFIGKCFLKENERFSAAEALNHPWLQRSREVVVPESTKILFSMNMTSFSSKPFLSRLLMEVMLYPEACSN
jgi:serine/threonine protein kinase